MTTNKKKVLKVLSSDEISEDLNAHTKCAKVIEAAIREFRLEVGKLRSKFAELSNLPTAKRSDVTRLHDENRDLKQRLQELEMQYDSLKRESRAIQDENKSLLTALRLLSSEIPSETKHTAPEINVQADGEWTQAKSSKRAKQSTSSLSSNKIYDQADENKEAAHASPQTTEHSAEQSGTQQSKRKRSVLLIGDSMIKAIEEQKHSKSHSAHASPQTTEHSAEQSGTQQSKGKRSILLIGDSMIKAIEEQKHSKSQSVKKICSWGVKTEVNILGDLNCNVAACPLELRTKNLLEIYNLYQYQQLINEHTRITEKCATIIDLFLTNNKEVLRILGSVTSE